MAGSLRIEIAESCEVKNSNSENFATEINKVDYKNVFTVVLVLLSCILLSAPTILIPQHDAIMNPEYWYEGMVNFHLTYPLHWLCIVYMNNKLLLRIESLVSFKSLAILYIVTVLTFDMTKVS